MKLKGRKRSARNDKANTMDNQIVKLLEDIKRLLILALTKQNIPGKRIADVLNIDPAIVSRILAPREKDNKRKTKKSRKKKK